MLEMARVPSGCNVRHTISDDFELVETGSQGHE